MPIDADAPWMKPGPKSIRLYASVSAVSSRRPKILLSGDPSSIPRSFIVSFSLHRSMQQDEYNSLSCYAGANHITPSLFHRPTD